MFDRIKNLFHKNRIKQTDQEIVNEALDDFMEETTPEGEEINPNEKLLLSNILCLKDLTAEDIMIHRMEMVAVKHGISFSDLIKAFSNSPRLQLPVYGDTLDNILGIVSIRDVLQFCFQPKNFNINTIIREAAFVAPSIKLDELLEQMRATGEHLLFVVDEFGGIDGLVTLEDLISRILGDIQQIDTPAPVPDLVKQQDGSYLMDARMLIEDAEKILSAKLLGSATDTGTPDVETIGGLIVSIANRVPAVGEIFNHPSGVVFEIADSDSRRIRRVVIRSVAENQG